MPEIQKKIYICYAWVLCLKVGCTAESASHLKSKHYQPRGQLLFSLAPVGQRQAQGHFEVAGMMGMPTM
jgi:hypothetical protein